MSAEDFAIVREALVAADRQEFFDLSDAFDALDRLEARLAEVERERDQLRQTCAISFSDKDAGIFTLIQRAEAAEARVVELEEGK